LAANRETKNRKQIDKTKGRRAYSIMVRKLKIKNFEISYREKNS
jgi:hypothetical protein